MSYRLQRSTKFDRGLETRMQTLLSSKFWAADFESDVCFAVLGHIFFQNFDYNFLLLLTTIESIIVKV